MADLIDKIAVHHILLKGGGQVNLVKFIFPGNNREIMKHDKLSRRLKVKYSGFFTVMVAILAVTMIVSTSSARDVQYEAKQVQNIVIDGQLNEWEDWSVANVISITQVFDGDAPPADDFTGSVIVGWSEADPSRVYFAVKIIDDAFQDIHPANDQHWHDDSMEFIFDSNNDGSAQQFTLDANGVDMSATATADNTEYAAVASGNEVILEVAIVPADGFAASVGDAIGLALAYNDSENGARETQIRWIANVNAWGDPANQGDLIFSASAMTPTAVEPSSKLATTWGSLK